MLRQHIPNSCKNETFLIVCLKRLFFSCTDMLRTLVQILRASCEGSTNENSVQMATHKNSLKKRITVFIRIDLGIEKL
jgi:hypothetical protein